MRKTYAEQTTRRRLRDRGPKLTVFGTTLFRERTYVLPRMDVDIAELATGRR